MRILAVVLCLALIGCAAITPDYNAKKVIRAPVPDRLILSSSIFGANCALETTDTGKEYRTVIVTVRLPEPEPVTILINGNPAARFEPDVYMALRYPAGLGQHTVRAESPSFFSELTFHVVHCEQLS